MEAFFIFHLNLPEEDSRHQLRMLNTETLHRRLKTVQAEGFRCVEFKTCRIFVG